MKIEKSHFGPSLKTVGARSTKINPNLYFILVIIVLKFKWIQIIEQKLLKGNLNVYGRRLLVPNIIHSQNFCSRIKIAGLTEMLWV